MSAALPLILPHLPSLRIWLEEWLSGATGAVTHSDAGYRCAIPFCGFIGQQLVEVRRLGRHELHQERDPRDAVTPAAVGGGGRANVTCSCYESLGILF